MTTITLNHTMVIWSWVKGHGVLQVSFKYFTNLLQVSYKSLTSLLQISYRPPTGQIHEKGHCSGVMDHGVIGHGLWVVGHGSWGRGHGVGSIGHLQVHGSAQIAFICSIASFVQKGYMSTNVRHLLSCSSQLKNVG